MDDAYKCQHVAAEHLQKLKMRGRKSYKSAIEHINGMEKWKIPLLTWFDNVD